LALAILVGSATPGMADGSIQFVPAYAGANRQAFDDVMAQAKTIVPGALAYITGQWGLPNTLQAPLIVRIVDKTSNLPGRPVSAYVRSFRTSAGLRQELVIDLSHHMLYPSENFENVLYHEMAHAILQDAVTGPTSAGIPQWFNEGLAQSVTTEGHDRTAEDFKRYAHTDAHAVICDLNGNVDTFYHGEFNFGCYTYFYLTVKRLIAKSGKEGLAHIIGGLHNGYPLPLVIANATHEDWNTFQADAAAYTRDVFDGKQPTLSRRRPSQQTLHPRQKIRRIKRFHEILLGPGLQPLHFVLRLREPSRHHHHGNMPRLRIALQVLADLEARHVRQLHIRDHHPRLDLPRGQ